jgi:peptidoglycan/LPS O-acetylase OafA/YrhL
MQPNKDLPHPAPEGIHRQLPRLHGIDALRGLAASVIVIHHVVRINQMQLPAFLSFIPAYFGYGVPLFFIISAFSLYYSYSVRLKGSSDIRAYAIHRFARIAPLFYFMLAVWSITSYYKFGLPPNPAEIIANLAFLFNFVPAWQNSVVWAGWSIGVEFLFYALLPLLIANVRTTWASVSVLAVSLGVAWSFQAAPDTSAASVSILMYAPFFAMGIITWGLFVERRSDSDRKSGIAALCGAVVLAAAVLSTGPIRSLMLTLPYKRVEFYMLGVVFALLVYSQAVHPVIAISNRAMRFLGEISFSLYLLHPWLILMLKPMYTQFTTRLSPALCFLLSTVCTFAVLIPVAWMTYRWIESPGMAFGKAWSRKPQLNESRTRVAPVEAAPATAGSAAD